MTCRWTCSSADPSLHVMCPSLRTIGTSMLGLKLASDWLTQPASMDHYY